MLKYFVSGVIFAGSIVALSQTASAIDEDDCGIWLCLPQGFPGGCEPHYAAYIKRITSTPPKPPLPKMSSCTEDSAGHYFNEGYVPYYPCKAGYTFSDKNGRDEPAKCSKQTKDSHGDAKTVSYNAVPREHPHYVQVFIDGEPAKHYGVGPTHDKDWHIEGNYFWYRR
ncbi:hypothetical protein O4H49_20015 [Kiloniella laminariae]|uniref:Conjugal transfer protein TraL n=1 Tax=Kiloniella laminariae TaxID=454162 RepID=A0ABT4LRX8_9PROT|nr:hypothetical protein [Kiloniella laminariae]MCZ4283081.1 hypothetical protein [Kiloniella laminariae]